MSHGSVQARINDLERQVAELQTQLRDRASTYESELATRDARNRALTSALRDLAAPSSRAVALLEES